MAYRKEPIPFGGVNLDSWIGSFNQESRFCENFRINANGGLEKFGGTSGFNENVIPADGATRTPIMNLFAVTDRTNVYAGRVYAFTSAAYYLVANSAGAWSCFSSKFTYEPIEFNFMEYYQGYNMSLFFADGANYLRAVTKDAPVAVYTYPNFDQIDHVTTSSQWVLKPRYILKHKTYMFLGGYAGHQDRLYFSDVGNPWSIRSTSFLSMARAITAMFEYQDSVYVMNEYFGERVTGTVFDNAVDVNLNPIGNQMKESLPEMPGTVAHQSVQIVDGMVYYVNRKGFVRWNGTRAEWFGKNRIDKWLVNTTQGGEYLKYVKSVHYKRFNEIWWTFGAYTGSASTIIYNYKQDMFYVLYNENTILRAANLGGVTPMAILPPDPLDSSKPDGIVTVGGYNRLMVLDVGREGVQQTYPIVSRYQSDFIGFDGLTQLKAKKRILMDAFHDLSVVGSQTNLTMKVYQDYNQTVQQTLNPILSTQYAGHRIALNLSASDFRTLSFSVYHDEMNRCPVINGWAVEIDDKDSSL